MKSKRIPYIMYVQAIATALLILLNLQCSNMMSDNSEDPDPIIVQIITPYLWIANSTSNSIAQVDIESGETIRVIQIDPLVGSNPSRTAIDYNFNCWVALRGQGNDNMPDRIIKIDAETGDVTVGPQVGEYLRGVAINREGNVWVSSSQPDSVLNSGGYGWQLIDPRDLSSKQTLTDTTGSYGLAINPHNKLFSTCPGQPVIIRKNALTGELEQKWTFDISSLGASFLYGIAADQEGNMWNTTYGKSYVIGYSWNYQCPGGTSECTRDLVDGIVAVADVKDAVIAAGGPAELSGRGVCVDAEGNIWAAFHSIGGTYESYVVKIDSATRQPTVALPTGNMTVGVTADHNGNIWAVNRMGGGPNFVNTACPDGITGTTGTVTKINPGDGSIQTFPTCGEGPYTYSDMAGFALRGIVMQAPMDPGNNTSTYPSGVFVVNNNDDFAFKKEVTLNMNVLNAAEMCFKNGNDPWSPWEPYSAIKSWTLTPNDGSKTVYGLFKSSTGDETTLGDTIILRSEEIVNSSDGIANDLFGGSVAVSGNGNTFGTVADGTLYIYTRNGITWNEEIIDASDGFLFSGSVAISNDGSMVIVGAVSDNTNGTDSGSVYIYKWNGISWDESKIFPTSATLEGGDRFGSSAAVTEDGTLIIVGAEGDDIGANTDQGSAFAFYWNGSAWVEAMQIVSSEGNGSDNFGCSVSVSSSGDTIAIGSSNDDDNGSNSGSVYIYRWNGISHTEIKVTADDGAGGDRFGLSVAVSSDGNYILAGSPYSSGSRGAVYLYELNGADWDEYKYTASDGLGGDLFGYDVSISNDGTKLLAGAPNDNTGNGSMYMISRIGYITTTIQFTSVLNEAGARFGESVSSSTDMDVIVVGAPLSNVGTNNDQGTVYIY